MIYFRSKATIEFGRPHRGFLLRGCLFTHRRIWRSRAHLSSGKELPITVWVGDDNWQHNFSHAKAPSAKV